MSQIHRLFVRAFREGFAGWFRCMDTIRLRVVGQPRGARPHSNLEEIEAACLECHGRSMQAVIFDSLAGKEAVAWPRHHEVNQILEGPHVLGVLSHCK